VKVYIVRGPPHLKCRMSLESGAVLRSVSVFEAFSQSSPQLEIAEPKARKGHDRKSGVRKQNNVT
jgi:hypothetical protein